MPYNNIEDFRDNCTVKVVWGQSFDLLRLIFEPTDIIEIRKLPSRRSIWKERHEWQASVVGGLCKSNFAGQDIFFGINPRDEIGGRSSRNVPRCRCLMASFSEHYSVAKSQWLGAGLPFPTAIVRHDNGCFLFGRLEYPVSTTEWVELQKCLISLTGCAPLKDAARVIHLPGFYWHGSGNHSQVSEFKFDSVIASESLKKLADFYKAIAYED